VPTCGTASSSTQQITLSRTSGPMLSARSPPPIFARSWRARRVEFGAVHCGSLLGIYTRPMARFSPRLPKRETWEPPSLCVPHREKGDQGKEGAVAGDLHPHWRIALGALVRGFANLHGCAPEIVRLGVLTGCQQSLADAPSPP
jgi:hypothetical protein